MLGLATAETSATARRAQPASVCHEGFEKYVLQPLPAPLQAVSLKPRAEPSSTRLVPPTAITWFETAGNEVP